MGLDPWLCPALVLGATGQQPTLCLLPQGLRIQGGAHALQSSLPRRWAVKEGFSKTE